jgi:hypothetical protein
MSSLACATLWLVTSVMLRVTPLEFAELRISHFTGRGRAERARIVELSTSVFLENGSAECAATLFTRLVRVSCRAASAV